MRRYETVFILRPDLGEAQIKDTVSRYEQMIATGGGEMVERDDWGIRDLTYNIKRERRGYYVRLDYVSPAAVVNEVERNLKLADDVLRFLSVMVAPEADPAALRADIEARRRKIAEAKAAVLAAAEAPPVAEPQPVTSDGGESVAPGSAEKGDPGGPDQS